MFRDDPPREELLLRGERPSSLAAERELSHQLVADVLARGMTVQRDALSDDRLIERLEATLAATCAMLDLRFAALEDRVARLE